jgi:predicted neutral ceramidase superfamily lipid hydrolase
MEPGLREQIAEGLRQVVDVAVVLTSEKRRALTA